MFALLFCSHNFRNTKLVFSACTTHPVCPRYFMYSIYPSHSTHYVIKSHFFGLFLLYSPCRRYSSHRMTGSGDGSRRNPLHGCALPLGRLPRPGGARPSSRQVRALDKENVCIPFSLYMYMYVHICVYVCTNMYIYIYTLYAYWIIPFVIELA